MNHTVLVLSVAFIALMMILETYFKPRLDITVNHDVLLWYYNRKRERVYVLLFNLY